MEKPKLCILFITYNHANYVKESLDSILMQKTNFPFQVVVGDDCSKDGTRDIIETYALNYPGKIILSNPAVNLGAEKNFNQLLARCIEIDSDYIAYLEGDDYWLDEYRLQKQFDALEKSPVIGLVYGKHKILNNKNELVTYKIPSYKSGDVFEDIILCRFLPPLHSSFFRTSLMKEIFAQKNFIGLDFYIMAEIAKRKKLQYIDEYFFVYRQTAGSITNIQAGNVTKQFYQVISLYKNDYPELVRKGLKIGGRKLLYNQVADKPSLKNLSMLFKTFTFSFLHLKQIIKWFYLRMRSF
ncbi:MAG TPA: glycosyltransferase [Ferruginibacter sp.]|nr:glycosyltransferase [Ferruginibacter sp.]